jgi:hypothetical protein
MKTCIACGMPMVKAEEFAMGDTAKDYCIYCARPDGSMQSYEEKLDGMTKFIIKTQGFEEKAAGAAAREMMAKLPAWQGRGLR